MEWVIFYSYSVKQVFYFISQINVRTKNREQRIFQYFIFLNLRIIILEGELLLLI